MIHQVPMKSLPQEWLWCETWCDDASKAAAKTIDLVTICVKTHSCKLILTDGDFDTSLPSLLCQSSWKLGLYEQGLHALLIISFQCNNPQTKEPKLVSAVRIVKEWPDYDNEIKRLQERVAEKKSQTSNDEKSTGKYWNRKEPGNEVEYSILNFEESGEQ